MSKNQGSRKAVKDADGVRDIPEFIQKLFKMLETKSFRHTFCWGPDGTTFMVKDTNEFSRTILPQHFKHCNFASFVRQLNKYDFHKVRNAEDAQKQPSSGQAWEFVHPKFRRDRRDLLDEIRRKTPGTAKRERPNEPSSLDQASNLPSSSLSGVGAVCSSGSSNTATSLETGDFVAMEGNVAVSGSNLDRSADAMGGFAQLAAGLQEQIDFLKRSHAEMEAKLHTLGRADELIRKELADVNQNLAAKDAWIQELLKTRNATDGVAPPPAKAWPQNTPIPTAPAPAEASVTELPSSSEATANAAAAAASMNAGSLIGSPFKTQDGLGFVTLGRVAPKTSQSDHRLAIEITSPSGAGHLAQQNGHGQGSKTPQDDWTVAPRVLLVDDDSVYRDLSKRLLKLMGCEIYLAKDGVEALRQMGLEKYDLILMDIVMPNLDGISATRNIRQYDALTPIISMTSNFSDTDIMQYIGSGMTDILPKPFSKKTLYSILEKYCAHLKTIQSVHGAYFPTTGLSIAPPLPLPSSNSNYTTATTSNANGSSSSSSSNNNSNSSSSANNNTSSSSSNSNTNNTHNTNSTHSSLNGNNETTTAMTLPFFSTSPVFINHDYNQTMQCWPQVLPPNTEGDNNVIRSSIVVGDNDKFMWAAAPPSNPPTAPDSTPTTLTSHANMASMTADKDDQGNRKRLKIEP